MNTLRFLILLLASAAYYASKETPDIYGEWSLVDEEGFYYEWSISKNGTIGLVFPELHGTAELGYVLDQENLSVTILTGEVWTYQISEVAETHFKMRKMQYHADSSGYDLLDEILVRQLPDTAYTYTKYKLDVDNAHGDSRDSAAVHHRLMQQAIFRWTASQN